MGKASNKKAAARVDAAAAAKQPAASVTWHPVAIFARFGSWVTGAQHALYSLSLLRIIYGVTILAFLGTNAADRQYLWGVASGWVEPEAKRRGYWGIFEVLFSKDNAFLFDISYGILTVLALAFLVGFQTRYVTPLLLLFWVGLATNSTVLTNGGDTIMRLSLLFLVFANLSQHWSVDAWLRRKRGEPAPILRGRFAVPDWARNAAHNTGIILCCYQIMLVYVNSGIYKLMGEEWRDGTGFYYSLVLDVFRPFPGLSDLAWQITLGVYVATWLSVWVQLLFPILAIWRITRIVGLIFLLGMHTGIGLFLGLWPFSLAMISLDLLFVRDRSWKAALRWAREVFAALKEIFVNRRVPAAFATPAAATPVASPPATAQADAVDVAEVEIDVETVRAGDIFIGDPPPGEAVRDADADADANPDAEDDADAEVDVDTVVRSRS